LQYSPISCCKCFFFPGSVVTSQNINPNTPTTQPVGNQLNNNNGGISSSVSIGVGVGVSLGVIVLGILLLGAIFFFSGKEKILKLKLVFISPLD